jgi:hypothetical protein
MRKESSNQSILAVYLDSSAAVSSGAKCFLKARFVAGGSMQDRAAYHSEETPFPTVSLTSIYIVMSVCALERRYCGTMDIGSAYLNADMVREVNLSVQCGVTNKFYMEKILVEVVLR